MSHEPGREAHMTYHCEHCGSAFGPLVYNEHHDEYWCESCIDNAQEANLESPPESAREEQSRTWEEHQKAHKR